MTDKFEIGEIAIVCNVPATPEFHGIECEIVGRLELRAGFDSQGCLHETMAYEIRIPTIGSSWIGSLACARPDQLRKKRPSRSDTGEIRVMGLFHVEYIKTPEPA